ALPILLVRRIFRRVVPHVGPGDEHDGRDPVLHVGPVVARAVVLVDLDVEGVAAARRRGDAYARRVPVRAIAYALAGQLGAVLHHALADIVDVRRKGGGGAR